MREWLKVGGRDIRNGFRNGVFADGAVLGVILLSVAWRLDLLWRIMTW